MSRKEIANCDNNYTESRFLEMLIISSFGIIFCAVVFCEMFFSLDSLKADQLVTAIDCMVDRAYAISAKLDAKNLQKANMKAKGFSVVNHNNAWYMICNLREVMKGKNVDKDLMAEKLSRNKRLAGTIPANNGKYVAVFLRFSDKGTTPHARTQHRENFVNVLNNDSEFLKSL